MPRNTEVQDNKEQITKTNVRTRTNAANLWLGTVAVLLTLILLSGVFAAGRHWSRANDKPGIFATRLAGGSPEFGVHRMGRFMNTSDRVVGVVTKVNSDHFTVAGNGATKDVQTTSSTQYQDGSGVKVNDSVLVLGNTSNNQFTATQIVINP